MDTGHKFVNFVVLTTNLFHSEANVIYIIRYTSKRMQQFVKICTPLLIRKCARLFWFAGIRIAALLFLTHRNLVSTPHFTAKGGKLQRGHQSAAHTVEEKQCTHVFKCRCCGAFVALFFMLMVH